MIEILKTWIEGFGISGTGADFLCWALAAVLVIVLAIIVNFIVSKIILKIVSVLIKSSKSKWDDALLNRRVFHRLANLAPIIVIYFFAPVFAEIQAWIEGASFCAIVIIGTLVIDAFLSSVEDVYRSYEISKERPIKGYLQVVKIIIYVFTSILVLSIVLGQSPIVFLSGLGAMTAVILLIFKDSILGLVAGIQLSANKMIRRGDWISMPKYGADGDVIDVTLNTVKVQNWDKTVSTIPTYALISDSFKNWRGMEESGGRRIKRSVHIDMQSIKFCTEEMLNKFRKIQYISEYIDKKSEEIEKYNSEYNFDRSIKVNGRALTNIGTFRSYLNSYLRNHPMIKQDMTFLIRHLDPSEHGLPVQIYVFSADQAWANYEAIQADIFDHVLAVIPEFDLKVFQNPSGHDFRSLSGKIAN
ncbi:MAG: mechanosensitive ion channel [candidate division Zixibacteria bacterium]|nr:mechanosensitive ion channel [candidate division Zixibacteria bacterium]